LYNTCFLLSLSLSGYKISFFFYVLGENLTVLFYAESNNIGLYIENSWFMFVDIDTDIPFVYADVLKVKN
jgi:hypothetical protein